MTRAVAIGQVVQGDKERPELTDMINSTCAVDLAELEGDDATGADVCQEYKVVSPLTKTHRTGRGSKVHGGSVANVGHLYAFGNTEERYRIKILGCKGRGRLGKDPPFNHATGVGSVKARPGDYFDALRNKKAIVVPMILEAQRTRRHRAAFPPLHPAPGATGERCARARRHRLRAVAPVVLQTPHAAARGCGAGGRRQGDPAEDHPNEDTPDEGRA